jgi:hypothetical protein
VRPLDGAGQLEQAGGRGEQGDNPDRGQNGEAGQNKRRGRGGWHEQISACSDQQPSGEHRDQNKAAAGLSPAFQHRVVAPHQIAPKAAYPIRQAGRFTLSLRLRLFNVVDRPGIQGSFEPRVRSVYCRLLSD